MTTTIAWPVGAGIFPLDEALGCSSGVYSPTLQQQMAWLSGLLPYGQVEQVFARLTGQLLPTASLWVEAQRVGQRLCAEAERQREQVKLERTEWEHRRYDPRARKSISLDGGMVNVRGEGWKEVKVGVISDLAGLGQTRALSAIRYTAVVGDPVRFARAFWALAVEHEVPYAGETVVTADGASWIWRLAADLFPTSVQIVDWYHARQHLAQAGQARFPADADRAKRWYLHMSEQLFLGQVWVIIADLQANGLAELARYFQTHQRRMQYDEFRTQGYPIGSGVVESGVKQFKQRLSAAGMRWSRAGLERMLALRTAVLSHPRDPLCLSA